MLVALRSFYPWCIFLMEIFKIEHYEFFLKKENISFKIKKYFHLWHSSRSCLAFVLQNRLDLKRCHILNHLCENSKTN